MREIRFSRRIAHKSPRRRDIFRRRLYVGILLFGVVVGSALFSVNNTYLFVRSISVTGTRQISSGDIIRIAEETLLGSYAHAVPKRNILFYPKNEIREKLSETFPKLKNTVIVRDRIFNIVISVSEREEKYRFCQKESTLSPDGMCYSMDESGIVFMEALAEGGSKVFFKEKNASTTPAEVAIPSEIISEQNMRIIGFLEDGIERLGFSIYSISLGEISDVSFWLRDSNGKESSQKIEASYGKDPYRTLSSFDAALSAEPLKRKITSARDTLIYIDLRFGNKVFFKFK